MKPLVGVMPLWDEERESIWMLPGYMDGIAQAGATPFIFPFSCDREELARLVCMCDGILFTGGQDVSPKIYHELPMDGLISCCEKRDEMETIVLRAALENDKPWHPVHQRGAGRHFVSGHSDAASVRGRASSASALSYSGP